MPHKVVDADACAFAFSQKEGQALRLVLVDVDTACQGIAFGIRQRVADGVTSANGSRPVALFHGKHNIQNADMRRRAQPDGECAAKVIFNPWQVEAHSVAPLPTLFGQRLVTVI